LVPSHCGLLGIKKANYLAKMGSHKKKTPSTLSFHSAKAHIKAVVRSRVKNKWNTDFKEKDWENSFKRNSETAQSRKAEVAKFRLNTGIGKHLKRFNIGIQDRVQLRSCSVLQDKLSDVDNFKNMTKTEKESICY
jgi:hypothetical protein